LYHRVSSVVTSKVALQTLQSCQDVCWDVEADRGSFESCRASVGRNGEGDIDVPLEGNRSIPCICDNQTNGSFRALAQVL
jgi:hypothetical protein